MTATAPRETLTDLTANGAHYDALVGALLAQWHALSADEPVRLAKRTSNVFRLRQQSTSPGLNVDGLQGVLSIDVERGTAEVLGMTTYEDLVDATLAYRLMPLVVPQLKTITLGGAVTGLGIESTSFREGLPHESVLEMDILTGSGQVVTARPDNEHSDLFFGFPNSYGTLGYAVRLTIALAPVAPYVSLRHVRFHNADDAARVIARISQTHQWDSQQVDFLDGTVFSPSEIYLTLGQWADTAEQTPSDYTGRDIYFSSIRTRGSDVLTVRDYLWRWDTDWFWCSAGLGLQKPWIRALVPKRYLRSDVYHRVVNWGRRSGAVDAWATLRGRPEPEYVIQDIEVPVATCRGGASSRMATLQGA
jgi:FAD/FMN-containing dehydrogenase